MSDNRGANLSRMVLKQAGRAKEKVTNIFFFGWGACYAHLYIRQTWVVSALFEKFGWIPLYLTDDAFAKLYVT